MIICLGPICIPLWGLLPFLMIVFKKLYTWVTGKDYDDGSASKGDTEAIDKKVAELTAASDSDNSTTTLRQRHQQTSGVLKVSSEDEWIEVLAKAKITKSCVYVKFTATWCGPCKKIAPIFEELSTSASGRVFIEVDVDKNPALTKRYGISSMPTFLVFKNSQRVDEMLGADEEKLRSLVDKHK